MPIRNDDIQLVEEQVSIRLTIDEEEGKWGIPFFPRCDVRAVFELRNTSDHSVDLQLGFPFMDLQGFGDEQLVRDKLDFQVREQENEREVSLKEGVIEPALDPTGLFKKVYVWEEHFEASAAKTLTVSYRLLMGAGSARSMRGVEQPQMKYRALDRLFPALAYSFMYITETAYTWKPPVVTADFELDFGELLEEFDKSDCVSRFGDGVAMKFGRPVFLHDVQPAPGVNEQGVWRWAFNGEVPKHGIAAQFIVLLVPARLEEIDAFVSDTAGALTAELWRDEYLEILRGYYSRILAQPIQGESQFTTGYFEPIDFLKAKLLFPSDREGLIRIQQRLTGMQ